MGCDGDSDGDGGGRYTIRKVCWVKTNSRAKFSFSQRFASGPPLASPLVVSIDATAIIATPSYTLHLEIHQMRTPTFATPPAPHRRLAVIHCRRHPPSPLPNTIFFAIASPPPHHWCPSPPLSSNDIVILRCRRHCTPSSSSTASTAAASATAAAICVVERFTLVH